MITGMRCKNLSEGEGMARKGGKHTTEKHHAQDALYSYIEEKLRIHRTFMLVKKERLRDDLRLLEKREKQIAFLQKKMDALQHSMSKNVQRIERKINSLSRESETESVKLQQYELITRALQANTEQTKKAYASKEGELKKEGKLLNELNIVAQMCETLDDRKREEVRCIVRKKQHLFATSQRLHKEEVLLLSAEKKAVQEMAQRHAHDIRAITGKLRTLHASYQKILKEKRTLHEQEEGFQRQLRQIARRKRSLSMSLGGKA